jgi:hypothetical protein
VSPAEQAPQPVVDALMAEMRCRKAEFSDHCVRDEHMLWTERGCADAARLADLVYRAIKQQEGKP